MSSSEFHHYTRDEFLAEFYPDPADKAAIAAGMEQLRAEQRAFRLAEMRRRLGITQKNSKPNHPQTQGKAGRFQQTMKNSLRAQPHQPATIAELQALLDTFAGIYSTRRPHRSLPGRATPAAAYAARVSRFGPEKVAAFEAMRATFGDPDLAPLADAYGHRIIGEA